jgi:hypothetical protein
MISKPKKPKYNKQKSKAKWKSYNVFEVADSFKDSKLIAESISDARRFAYRAKATVVGDSRVRPYEPIYIDGAPNGMSGYWTVLSVKHIFGSRVAKYMMELELGTDILGEVNEAAYKQQQTRDVSGELAGQAIKPAESKLVEYAVPVNDTQLTPNTIASPNISSPSNTLPIDESSPDLYQNSVPNFSNIPRSVSWVATSSRLVIS